MPVVKVLRLNNEIELVNRNEGAFNLQARASLRQVPNDAIHPREALGVNPTSLVGALAGGAPVLTHEAVFYGFSVSPL